MKYGHDACDALVGAHESAGAKEMTLQKNPAKQTLPETSALASNSMIGTISLSTAGSVQPPQHDPEKNNRLRNNVAFMRGRGSDGRASENDSPVLLSPVIQGREEPPEGRASSPVNAADVSQNLTTPRGSSKRRPEPTASHQILNFTRATHCICADPRVVKCELYAKKRATRIKLSRGREHIQTHVYATSQCCYSKERCPRRHRSFLTTKRTIQCYSAKDASYVCLFASEATCPYMDHQSRPIPPPGYTPTAPGYVPPASWPAPPPAGP